MGEEDVVIIASFLLIAGIIFYAMYQERKKAMEQVKPSYQNTWETTTQEEIGRYIERVYPIPQPTVAVSQAYIYSEPTQ